MTNTIPLALAVCCALSACGPDDGVLSWSFALQPTQNLILPSEEELGMVLDPLDLKGAEGICVADVVEGTLLCTVDGLPNVTSSLVSPHYRIGLRFSGFPIEPGGGAGAIESIGTVDLGRFVPDLIGHGEFALTDVNADLAYAQGGVVHIMVPVEDAQPRFYTILEGEVGNLDTGEDSPEPPGGGGHHH